MDNIRKDGDQYIKETITVVFSLTKEQIENRIVDLKHERDRIQQMYDIQSVRCNTQLVELNELLTNINNGAII
jgi:hypothetical protein